MQNLETHLKSDMKPGMIIMRYDPLRYFYRFFAFVLFRRIFVSFNKEIPLTKATVCFIIRSE